jgi:hypothetical protein
MTTPKTAPVVFKKYSTEIVFLPLVSPEMSKYLSITGKLDPIRDVGSSNMMKLDKNTPIKDK